MAMTICAEDIATTLIDVQCDIYRRHAAGCAPTDPVEYDKWVVEAMDFLLPIYGGANLDRHGRMLAEAMRLAACDGALISAEALDRLLFAGREAAGDGPWDAAV